MKWVRVDEASTSNLTILQYPLLLVYLIFFIFYDNLWYFSTRSNATQTIHLHSSNYLHIPTKGIT